MYWKKWAAKHEYEEVKEGAWVEPGLALLREQVKENWTGKHRNVAGKIFLEGGWTQKRLFDIGWSDNSRCHACQMEEGTEKHRLYHCPECHEVMEQKARTSKEEWKWQRGVFEHLLSGSQWDRGHFMIKWESEKHKSWDDRRRFQGPRCHGRLLARNGEKVGSLWLGGGAVGL